MLTTSRNRRNANVAACVLFILALFYLIVADASGLLILAVFAVTVVNARLAVAWGRIYQKQMGWQPDWNTFEADVLLPLPDGQFLPDLQHWIELEQESLDRLLANVAAWGGPEMYVARARARLRRENEGSTIPRCLPIN